MAIEKNRIRRTIDDLPAMPMRYAIKASLEEIEQLKSEGCSYMTIHAAMVERNILKCTYNSFMCALRRIKKEATPKKEVEEERTEWGKVEHANLKDIYGDD